MLAHDTAFTVEEQTFYRDSEIETRVYFDLGPVISAAKPKGAPPLRLITLGNRLSLQLSAQLAPTAERIEELRPLVAVTLGLSDHRLLQVAPVPASLGTVVLSTPGVDSTSGPVPVAAARPSGIFPFTVVVQVMLDGEAADHVKAAAAGDPGHLILKYPLTSTHSVPVRVTCSGDVGSRLVELRDLGLSGVAAVKFLLDEEILVLAIDAVASTPPEELQRLRSQTVEAAARSLDAFLLHHSVPSSATTIHVSIVEEVLTTLHSELTADIGAWMVDDLPPTTDPDPRDPDVSQPFVQVQIVVDPVPTLVDAVTVTAPSGEQLELRRSEADGLPASDGFYLIETSYRGSHPSFACERAPVNDTLLLGLDELGLAPLTIDAEQLRLTGARRLRVHLVQRRADGTVALDETLYFRPADATWRADLMIYLSNTEPATIDYDAAVTTAVGEQHTRHGTDVTGAIITIK